MTIRVLLADDQPLIRAGLRVLIDGTEGMSVVGEAGDGDEAVAMATSLRPDVVVMDIRMPGTDGITAAARLTSSTDVRVLMLTTFDDDEYVYGALRAGASGFLVKDMALDDILAAIRVIAGGDALIAPGVTRRLIGAFAQSGSRRKAKKSLDGLTEREVQVLALVGEGLTNAEIGERLYISVGTAKTHVARLLAKLDARDRVQLVIRAYEAGLAG
ncbi:DNA-binding response regulator [Actinorhabdospora filicis]|uniref:DNA-binding response regulator n=1 Tax=Actinorhabdospora filicis TaxID=1785913 RepID=A0A9W6W544_9ACTN|nr:response regulator transcription factor [Actinorhabdospora filicis]GLZ79972.1 DNA-binding response regulator [Actinorhabdospora filicis]